MISEPISHYRILKKLGAGGMGEVYLAEDTLLNRKVAIKFLPEDSIADPQAKKRLIREAQAAAMLDHPNICPIHEVGEEDGRSFIVMQYVEGETLADLIRRRPLDLRQFLAIAVQIADALAEAHSHQIIHRDIKPQNIMLTRRGQAKVLDFGLAKVVSPRLAADSEAQTASLLTETGAIVGTPAYMSPEQTRGELLDGRSDLFSFGAMLYEMASGRQPFAARSTAEVVAAILTREVLPLEQAAPGIPVEIGRIIGRCLEKDRERRYQTMRDLALDLERVRRECESGQSVAAISDAPTASIRVAATQRGARLRALLRSRVTLALAVAVVPVVALYALFFGASTSTPAIRSLAVLPLENLSGDSTQDYFSDGLTWGVINSLSQLGSLRITSHTTMMAYKGTRKTLAEIARELNVDAVVEGTVLRSGERVRITAQLIQADTEQNLWAYEYNHDLRDVLALQSEVARAIANEIKIKLTPQVQAHLASAAAVNPEAYDAYLRGLYHLRRLNRVDIDKAITLLEQATALDTTFAAAYAQLARAYHQRTFWVAPQEKEWEEKAFVALEKALRLDANLAEAYHVRGMLLWRPANHFPHEKAIQEFRRALELNPSLDDAQVQLMNVYSHIGLLDQGLDAAQKAVAISPNNSLARLRVGVMFNYQFKFEEALGVFNTVPKEDSPSNWAYQTGWALFQSGKKDQARALVREYLTKYPDDVGGAVTSLEAILLADAGEERQAEERIERAAEIGKDFGHFHHTAYYIASAYALMNRPEMALKWLKRAAEDGFPCYPLFEKDPALDHLRKDERFIAFMAELKPRWEGYQSEFR